ncbi:hypothetical protein LV82_01264 [Albidovulum inexpectatum]|uniref:Uncharacterized protein n=1 Tax=Albidovulum inexpectatum TaxID=196587 RepID=A0A2S5JIL6_9RHOB|nr:hypothetical protein [Albidovulum inexpectatum]PPB81221.1 hypothetical protein LV82_01264 [Albidovulum inexpectatum]
MPHLVRVYIRNVVIGFVLSAVFVAALLWTNVGNLWHLVSTSPQGWIAVVMLVFFNGIVFAGVQFAIAIMRMADDDGNSGGRRQRTNPVPAVVPATVPVTSEPRG